MIDAEMGRIGGGTSQAGFGPAPRVTSLYSSWKATELKQFVFSYWLVVLDGHLPRRILHGLSIFNALVDLWPRAPFLMATSPEWADVQWSFFSSMSENVSVMSSKEPACASS